MLAAGCVPSPSSVTVALPPVVTMVTVPLYRPPAGGAKLTDRLHDSVGASTSRQRLSPWNPRPCAVKAWIVIGWPPSLRSSTKRASDSVPGDCGGKTIDVGVTERWAGGAGLKPVPLDRKSVVEGKRGD